MAFALKNWLNKGEGSPTNLNAAGLKDMETRLSAYSETVANALVVGSSAIATGAVTAVKIGSEAVEEAKIKAEAVTTQKLANLAVTTVKIAEAAITEAKLAAEAVGEGKIKNAAVGTSKLSSTVTQKIGKSGSTTLEIGGTTGGYATIEHNAGFIPKSVVVSVQGAFQCIATADTFETNKFRCGVYRVDGVNVGTVTVNWIVRAE